MSGGNEAPGLSGGVEGAVERIVGLVDNSAKRVMWRNDRVDREVAKRPVYGIIESGETHYMGPCHDLTAVALELLRTSGIEASAVLEELEDSQMGMRRVHFAIEFAYSGMPYFLDFNSMNKVVFGAGDYCNTKMGVKTLSVARFPGRKINNFKPLHANLGIEPASFSHIVERMKNDNTEERWKRYCAAVGDGRLFVVTVPPLSPAVAMPYCPAPFPQPAAAERS